MEEVTQIFDAFETEANDLMAELEAVLNAASPAIDLALTVQREGICKADVHQFAEWGIHLATNATPIEKFTEHRSNAQRVMAGEGMVSGAFKFVGGALSILAKIIGSIFGAIGKFIRWITGTGDSYSSASFSSASSAASSITPEAPKTVNNGANTLRHLPTTKQRGFFDAVKSLRTSLWMSNSVIIDPKISMIGDPEKNIPIAIQDAQLRVKYATTIIQGFDTLLSGVNRIGSVDDVNDVQNSLDDVWEELSIANYKQFPLDFKKAQETKRKDIQLAQVKLKKTLAETPLDDKDFQNLARDIGLLNGFASVVDKLASKSTIRTWTKAIDTATRYAKDVEAISEKIENLANKDTLTPEDLANVKGIFTTINADTRVLSTLLTEHIIAFGRVISSSKISKMTLTTIEEGCKAIAKHQADNDKDYEITIDIYGTYIGKGGK